MILKKSNKKYRNQINSEFQKGSTKIEKLKEPKILEEIGKDFNLDLSSENVNEYFKNLEVIDSQISKNRITFFKNLKLIILKILRCNQIQEDDIHVLTKLEKSLLIIFLKKKYSLKSLDILTPEALNSIHNHSKFKRFEENIKFVFLKGIRFLEKIFHRKLYSSIRHHLPSQYQHLDEHQKIEYAFYGYYFGHLLEEVNLPIESFFRPRYFIPKNQKNNQRLFPKTVSKVYINLVKLSSVFKNDFLFYLKNYYQGEMKSMILNRTIQMISEWEMNYFEGGEDKLMKYMSSKLGRKSKSKMIWSIAEIKIASDELIEILK